MNRKEAARRRLQLRRAKANSHAGSDTQSISDFERGCMYAAILFGVSFGLMFFVGVMWL